MAGFQQSITTRTVLGVQSRTTSAGSPSLMYPFTVHSAWGLSYASPRALFYYFERMVLFYCFMTRLVDHITTAKMSRNLKHCLLRYSIPWFKFYFSYSLSLFFSPLRVLLIPYFLFPSLFLSSHLIFYPPLFFSFLPSFSSFLHSFYSLFIFSPASLIEQGIFILFRCRTHPLSCASFQRLNLKNELLRT